MAAKGARASGLRREATPVAMVVAVVILVLVLGVGGFYAYNGGWKTAAQQDEDYKHNYLPLMAARHGNMEAFEAENKLRKEHGEPLLVLPQDKQQANANNRQKLLDLQKQLQARQGQQSAP